MAKVSITNVTAWWSWNVPLSTGIVVVTTLILAPLVGWALASGNRLHWAALIMVGLVPILIRWPVVSTVGLYAFLLPFESVSTIPGGASLLKPVGLLAAAMCVAAGLMERRLGRPPSAAIWWGLFVVWCAFSAAWALNPDLVFERLPTTFSLFLLYLAAVSIRPSRSEFYWVCVLAVVGGALTAAGGYFYGLEDSVRAGVVIGNRASNPNTLGAVLVLPLALAIAGATGLRSVGEKLMAIGAVGVISVGIFSSMSRGALLAVIVTILVLLYRLRVRWQVLFAAAVLLAMVGAMPDAFFTRITRVFTGEDATGSGRTDIWAVALDSLKRFGIFGTGLDNSLVTYGRFVSLGPRQFARGVHNTYLGVWVELGIIGLGLMLAALVSQLRAVHKAWKAGRGGIVLAALEAACIGVLASAAFGDNTWTKTFWFTWILLAWATGRVESKTPTDDLQRRRSRVAPSCATHFETNIGRENPR